MTDRDQEMRRRDMRRRIRARSRTEYVWLDSSECKACWKCIEACPENVFGKINILLHKHARIVNRHRCTGCRKCLKACDYGAINPVPKNAEQGATPRDEYSP